MGKFLLILGAASLGVAAYVIFSNEGGLAGDGDFSTEAGAWGTKQRVTGTGGKLGGKLEKGFGDLTGDPAVQGQGLVDQAVGTVKDAAGQAAHAVSDAVGEAKS